MSYANWRRHKFRDCRHRLRAVAMVIEDGLSRAGIAGDAGVNVQTVCDWMKRFNVEGLEVLRDDARSGRPPLPDAERTATVASWLEVGPDLMRAKRPAGTALPTPSCPRCVRSAPAS